MAMVYPELDRARRKASPLDFYRSAGWHAEWVTRHIGQCETYNNSANQAAKTTTAAAIAVSLAIGRESLAAFDGSPIPLPTLWPDVAIGIGTPSYKLGEGSILDYIRKFLGDTEVREGRTSAGTSTFHVKHRRNRPDAPLAEWSVIYVFPYEGPDPEEVRLDAWFADGPPPESWLRAIRNRGKRGRPLCGLITATPAKASEWEPIAAQYPEETLTIDARRRARIQSSVYDNRFLHRAGCPGYDSGAGYCGCACPDIVRQELANEGMADARARLFGEHVNLSGGCPWKPELLKRWFDRCRDPLDTVSFVVQGERDGLNGLDAVAITCNLEVYRDPEPYDQPIVICDVGRGIDDGRHDPDCIHVRSRVREDRALMARVNEYLGPWGLGMAAIEVAKAYNDAKIYVARGGGYGEAVLSALRVAGYHNVGHELDATKTSQGVSTLGVTESTETRIKAVQAVGSMLQRGRYDIPARSVIRCFSNCIIDKAGKIVARNGIDPTTHRPYHDEDMVLVGHGNRLLDMLGDLPVYATREKSLSESFREQMQRDGWRNVAPERSGYRGPRDVVKW